MKKVTVAVAAALLFFAAGNASATPLVDGILGIGEWTSGLIINGYDINEGGIPDDYDIARVAMYSETLGGGLGNGLYVLIQLHGTPTFVSLDPTPPIDPVFYTTGLDFDPDGDGNIYNDFISPVDRILDFRAAGFTIYDGLGNVISGSPVAIMGGVVEYFVPAAMFSSFPLGGFQTFTLLDNAGEPADDRIPNEGYDTPIPEPASMLLIGSGLLGALGFARRKRNAS